MNRLIDHAVRLQELGYWPLIISPMSKIPTERFRGRDPPSRDELIRQLRRNSRFNIAVRLPGLLAMDADDEQARQVIKQYDTPFIQRTPSNGEHRLFRLRDGIRANCRQKVGGIGLDIKTGENSFLMLSPSTLPHGRYESIGQLVPPEQLPEIDITPFQKEPQPKPQLRRPLIETPDMNRVYRYLDKCDVSVSGNHGHRTFFGVCCRLLRAFPWLEWDAFVSAVAYYSEHRSDPPWSEKEQFHKATDAWRKERLS